MTQRTWLITGISSGFGFEITRQLLENGDKVIGTVRRKDKINDFIHKYPDTFDCEFLDVTDVSAVQALVDRAFARHGRIDVIVSNAGYGLLGAAEELSVSQMDHIIATNLTGSIVLIKSSLPYLRKQGGGRIIQLSSFGGQVAFPGGSLYHATKFGIEGFCDAVAQEVRPFHIGVTLVEPGGARTEFLHGSLKVAHLASAYDGNPAHGFLAVLESPDSMTPGDPVRMAARIIESVAMEPAPLRMVLGSQALSLTVAALKSRLADYEAQTELAASTDFPAGE